MLVFGHVRKGGDLGTVRLRQWDTLTPCGGVHGICRGIGDDQAPIGLDHFLLASLYQPMDDRNSIHCRPIYRYA